MRVPTTAATVTDGLILVAEPAPEMHVNLVLVTQLVVAHAVRLRYAVGVRSELTKLVPSTLSVCEPEPGEFGLMLLTVGASNVNTCICVPTTALMVTVAVTLVPYEFVAVRHVTPVPDAHIDVWHGVDPSLIDGDVLYELPNEKPAMVTLAPPDGAEFGSAP